MSGINDYRRINYYVAREKGLIEPNAKLTETDADFILDKMMINSFSIIRLRSTFAYLQDDAALLSIKLPRQNKIFVLSIWFFTIVFVTRDENRDWCI